MMEGKRKEEREGEREDVSAQMPRAGKSALGKGLLGPKGTSQAGGATLSPWASLLPLLAEEVHHHGPGCYLERRQYTAAGLRPPAPQCSACTQSHCPSG